MYLDSLLQDPDPSAEPIIYQDDGYYETVTLKSGKKDTSFNHCPGPTLSRMPDTIDAMTVKFCRALRRQLDEHRQRLERDELINVVAKLVKYHKLEQTNGFTWIKPGAALQMPEPAWAEAEGAKRSMSAKEAIASAIKNTEKEFKNSQEVMRRRRCYVELLTARTVFSEESGARWRRLMTISSSCMAALVWSSSVTRSETWPRHSNTFEKTWLFFVWRTVSMRRVFGDTKTSTWSFVSWEPPFRWRFVLS
eukprot:m.8310 g.8310  ORF g.8310 m.8310 type:complete len:250 (-) comp4048_c0_seq1:67-816(-)